MDNNKKTETILVLVLALIVLYWKFKKPWLLLAALVLGLIGLLVPSLAEKIDWAWTKLSHLMGLITSKVLLTVVFFLILFPLSLLAKLSGRRKIKLKAGNDSYFKSRTHVYTREDLENVW